MYTNRFSKNLRVLHSLLTSPLVCLTVALLVVLVAAGGCAKATKAPVQPPVSEEQAVADFVELTKGPVLLRVSQNRAALMWEADAEGFGELSYGVGEQLEKHISVKSERVEYRIRSKGGARQKKTAFIYKTWLKNLQPGQVYDYRITGPQTQSSVYSFRTVPADTDEVTFAVYGDSRSRPKRHRKIVEQIIKSKVDFVVNSGDLVTEGDRYRMWGPQFFEPLKGLAESVPVYAAKGNHDLSDENYFEKLLVPPGQSANFSFVYGPVHYSCGDNADEDSDPEELLNWITDDAGGGRALWKFVSYHIPSINFGGHWSDWGYPDAMPAFAEAGVDFVVTGHSHQYERFYPIIPPEGTNGSFVTYITSGSGGAPLYDLESSLYHAEAKKVHHFCLFHIKENKLIMDTIDINGRVIDHLEISKTGERLNEEYLQTAIPRQAVGLHHALRSGLLPLSEEPRKGRAFTVGYEVSVPELPESVDVTFEFRSKPGGYELPEPKTIVIPKSGLTFSTEVKITPLVDIKVFMDYVEELRLIDPPLWFDCSYQIGGIQAEFSRPVFLEFEED